MPQPQTHPCRQIIFYAATQTLSDMQLAVLATSLDSSMELWLNVICKSALTTVLASTLLSSSRVTAMDTSMVPFGLK